MQDWEARIAEHERELQGWRAACRAELARLTREARRGIWRRASRARREELAELAHAHVGSAPVDRAVAFLEELCAYYLEAPLPQERAKIRARMGSHFELFDLLWRWAEAVPDRIQSGADAGRLRLALAAVSIDDHRVETTQMLRLLGRLYVAAFRSGIDPEAAFGKVAAASNPGAAGGGGRTQSYLAGFSRSPWFREHVAPRLARGRNAG